MTSVTISAPPAAAPAGATADVAAFTSALREADLTETARTWARHALLDWLAVTVAGVREPLSDIIKAEFAGRPDDAATVIASKANARPSDAALINGAMGHALDYDDVNGEMMGHPTAAVAPAALALAEALDASGADLVRAIVVGHEVAAAVGRMAGRTHYETGFHATGTIGTFAAAAACAHLLALDAQRTEMALGVAATQAAGLKSMFGTMTKPLHAGKAAMNGLIAARLAQRGFTARDGALERPQGFAATMADGFAPLPVRPDPSAPFAVEDTLFKYHAACYLTHSTIEAVRALREREGLTLEDLAALVIYAPPTHRNVCDITDPRTGLDVKFSIRHLAVLALDGADTADLALYADAVATDPRIGEARSRVSFEGREPAATTGAGTERHAATVRLETRDGRSFVQTENVGIPAQDTGRQRERLEAKARAIVAPVLGEARADALVAAVAGLSDAADLRALRDAVR